MAKAVGLMSGGLDSLLATRLLQDQATDILCVCFVTPFFGARRAKAATKALGVPLEVVDFSEAHLAMVKDPASGYGSNMNPCIDCHAMMLRYAGDLMVQRGYDYLFTGEVLGERPMSQNKNSLRRVANLSGYRDRILRPLSAKLLEPTAMELEGLVDRDRLEAISGRSRKPQMAMADRYGIREYEAPGGGCLLTDPSYSRRLKSLFERVPDCRPAECRFVGMGRLFWIGERTFAVVGRRQAENDRIEAAARTEDAILHVTGNVPGATVLVVGRLDDDVLARAARLAVRYSDAVAGCPHPVTVRRGDVEDEMTAERPADDELDAWR